MAWSSGNLPRSTSNASAPSWPATPSELRQRSRFKVQSSKLDSERLPPSGAAPCAANDSQPGHAHVVLLQGRFELWVSVGLEGGPVEGGFQTFAIRSAQPKFHWQFTLANERMFAQRKTFVQFHLHLR